MKNCGRSSWEWGCALAYPYGIYRSAVGEERTQEKVGAGALHISVILTWSRSSIPLQQGVWLWGRHLRHGAGCPQSHGTGGNGAGFMSWGHPHCSSCVPTKAAAVFPWVERDPSIPSSTEEEPYQPPAATGVSGCGTGASHPTHALPITLRHAPCWSFRNGILRGAQQDTHSQGVGGNQTWDTPK